MSIATIFRRLFQRELPSGQCPDCGATWGMLCEHTCATRAAGMRQENAPICYDSLHHHCALTPHCCQGTCVNRRDD